MLSPGGFHTDGTLSGSPQGEHPMGDEQTLTWEAVLEDSCELGVERPAGSFVANAEEPVAGPDPSAPRLR